MRFDNALNGKFIKKAEVKKDEYYKFLDAGRQETSSYKNEKTGQPKMRTLFKLWGKGEEWTTDMNWTSIKEISKVYGPESDDWVGKWIKTYPQFDMGKRQNQLFFLPCEKSENEELDKQYKASLKPNESAQTEQKPLKPEDIAWEE